MSLCKWVFEWLLVGLGDRQVTSNSTGLQASEQNPLLLAQLFFQGTRRRWEARKWWRRRSGWRTMRCYEFSSIRACCSMPLAVNMPKKCDVTSCLCDTRRCHSNRFMQSDFDVTISIQYRSGGVAPTFRANRNTAEYSFNQARISLGISQPISLYEWFFWIVKIRWPLGRASSSCSL